MGGRGHEPHWRLERKMENKAHYALIGTFVLVAVIAALTFATWLSGREFDQEWDQYDVEFSGPVRGLTRGSEVRLNGLSVGEVIGLNFDPSNPNQVYVTVQVINNTPIFKDGFAQLEPQGLTGLNYIQIYPGTISMGKINAKTDRIPGKMSQFDNFLVGGENIIDGATSAIRRVNVLLSEDAINDFQGILNNINHITGNLRDADVDPELLDSMLTSIAQTARDISKTAGAIENAAISVDSIFGEDVKGLVSDAKGAVGKVGTAIDDYSNLAENSTLVAQDIRDAINRLSNSGLSDMEETTDALRDLMITLSNIADQLEKSPAQFIAGEEREVMELPQ